MMYCPALVKYTEEFLTDINRECRRGPASVQRICNDYDNVRTAIEAECNG